MGKLDTRSAGKLDSVHFARMLDYHLTVFCSFNLKCLYLFLLCNFVCTDSTAKAGSCFVSFRCLGSAEIRERTLRGMNKT